MKSPKKNARRPHMQDALSDFTNLDFIDLKDRFGAENARIILHTLEQFEGISEYLVTNLSYEERLVNVLSVMRDNIRYQTRH